MFQIYSMCQMIFMFFIELLHFSEVYHRCGPVYCTYGCAYRRYGAAYRRYCPALCRYGRAYRRYCFAYRRYGIAYRRYGFANRRYGPAYRRYGSVYCRYGSVYCRCGFHIADVAFHIADMALPWGFPETFLVFYEFGKQICFVFGPRSLKRDHNADLAHIVRRPVAHWSMDSVYRGVVVVVHPALAARVLNIL
jgi:hypothetical protein